MLQTESLDRCQKQGTPPGEEGRGLLPVIGSHEIGTSAGAPLQLQLHPNLQSSAMGRTTRSSASAGLLSRFIKQHTFGASHCHSPHLKRRLRYALCLSLARAVQRQAALRVSGAQLKRAEKALRGHQCQHRPHTGDPQQPSDPQAGAHALTTGTAWNTQQPSKVLSTQTDHPLSAFFLTQPQGPSPSHHQRQPH